MDLSVVIRQLPRLTPGYIVNLLRLQEALPDRLVHLTIPVLMLWGTGDRVVTEAGHMLVMQASKSSASQFYRYPNGFHNLLAEPKLKDSVMRDVFTWIRRLSNSPQ